MRNAMCNTDNIKQGHTLEPELRHTKEEMVYSHTGVCLVSQLLELTKIILQLRLMTSPVHTTPSLVHTTPYPVHTTPYPERAGAGSSDLYFDGVDGL